MMPAHQLVVAAVAALAALVAAAQTQAPPGPADAGDCERCGKIESIRPVTTKDTWTPLGSVSSSPAASVGGGAAGTSPSAITMFQIGPGFSKQGTVMLGAAGGAAYQTRPSQLNAKRWEIIVRMDAGGTRAVTQNYEPMLREGDRVRVMGTQLELLP
jgi:outer membrane lipoprotein SlyB